MSEETKKAVAETENGNGEEKKSFFSEEKIEVIVAILLGITAVFTAWASWVGSLHGGNQATNYASSNNMSSMANSDWNEASQSLVQDMLLWNDISDLQVEILYAESIGDEETEELDAYKLYYKCNDNLSESMADAIDYDFDAAAQEGAGYVIEWINDESLNSTISPFGDEEFVASYYASAQEELDEADALLEKGQQDNKNGDHFNLVTVIYSVVLFLLGIVGIFKKIPNRFIVTVIAALGFLAATIYMFTLPLPF